MYVCVANFNIIRNHVRKVLLLGQANILQRDAIGREKTRRAAKGKDNKSGRKIFPVPMTNTISPNFGHLYTLRPG